MRRQSIHREQGFTLIELLMAITLSGIIIGALASGFIVIMNGTAGAHDRFVNTAGAQTLSTYFTSDVNSANPSLVSTGAVGTGCATEPGGTTTNVVRMQWTEWTTVTQLTAFSVSYRTRQSGSDWQLVRYSCSGSADPATTASAILSAAPLQTDIVVRSLHAPVAPHQTQAMVSGRKITLSAFAALGQGDTTPYSYSLSAKMRVPTSVPAVSSLALFDTSPTNAGTVRWTVTFSETVSGVDASDFSLASSGVTGASITGITGSGASYIVTAGTGAGSGTLGLNLVDNDSISDSDTNLLGGTGTGNGNFTGGLYAVDRVAPTVTVNQKTGQADPASSSPIAFAVTFSESVSGFDATDVLRTGTATGGGVTVAGSGSSYEISVAGITGDGTVIVSIPAARATDSVGNANVVSTSTDNSVTYTAPPTVTSIVRAGSSPTSATTVSWTVTFNKIVTGVGSPDFALVPGSGVTGASITTVSGSGTTWTVTANRGSGFGTLGLDLVDDDTIVSGGVPLGGAGIGNGNFTGDPYTITGALSSVQLLNVGGGNTAGRLEKDDQIVVTFTKLMRVSSFCSAWSNDSNAQGPTNVVLTLTDGPGSTNDSLAITSSGCTIGTIDLGANGYVSGGDATFGATGTNSTMSWNASTFELTITLGKVSTGGGTGTPGTVASSTAVYTATGVVDTTGAAVDNSPFTLPAGAQF